MPFKLNPLTGKFDMVRESPAAPASHESAHVDGGSDELDSALDPRAYPLLAGLATNRPTVGVAGRSYYSTDTLVLERDNGTSWVEVARGETAIRLAQLSEKAHSSLTGVGASDHHAKTVSSDIDHGSVGGLADDDHAHYLKEEASGGLASEVPDHTHADASEAGTVAHSVLTGIGSSDHHDKYTDAAAKAAAIAGWTASRALETSAGGAIQASPVTLAELNYLDGVTGAIQGQIDAKVAAHAILDGTVHTDSIADAVTRGSLIYGNATPKWDELVLGAAGTVPRSDGTDLAFGHGAALQDADGDTKIQVEESADEDIIRFDAAGAEVMHIGGTLIDSTTTSYTANKLNDTSVDQPAGYTFQAHLVGKRAKLTAITGTSEVSAAGKLKDTGVFATAAGWVGRLVYNVTAGTGPWAITAVDDNDNVSIATTLVVFPNATDTYSITGDTRITAVDSGSVLSVADDIFQSGDDYTIVDTFAAIAGIEDADADTGIFVERTTDEDKIRMDVGGTEAFHLDAAGILTTVKQSGMRAYLSTHQTGITTGTGIEVALDTESYDVQNEFDTAEHRFTASVAGIYSVTAIAVVESTLVADKYYSPRLWKNGALHHVASQHSSHAFYLNCVLATTLQLAVNDFIEFYFYHNSGADRSLMGGEAQTQMSIAKIA